MFKLAVFQWVFYYGFYTRFFRNRITEFVDFCSVTNISIFIMTHTQFGYYIHGHSSHGDADISMQLLSQYLTKEREGLLSRRGLETNNDEQTFSISITDKLSRQYAKVMNPFYHVIHVLCLI
jgi:meckelin